MKIASAIIPILLALTVSSAWAGAGNVPQQVPAPQAERIPAKLPENCKLMGVFHADVDFTKEERQSIKTAVDTWRLQTDGLGCVLVVFDLDFRSIDTLQRYQNAHLIVKADSDTDAVRRIDAETGGEVLGLVMPPGGVRSGQPTRMLLIADRLHREPGQFHKVVLHELGHVLGMQHLMDSWSVMYPGYSKDQTPGCLQDVDLNEFCRVNSCVGRHLQSCE